MRGIFALLNSAAIFVRAKLRGRRRAGQAYVDETLDQLKKNVPSLRRIRPEATQSQNATASAAPAQDQSDSIQSAALAAQ